MPGYVTLVSSIYEHMCKLHVDRPRPLLMWCLSNSVGFRAADMPGGAHRMKEVTCQTQHANMPEKPPPSATARRTPMPVVHEEEGNKGA